jgi:RNA polymerase sigma-70 factor (ECF subfamily)
MSRESLNRRLGSITTLWSVVGAAHEPDPEAAQAAQRQLLARYGGAIRRYLLASLGDEDAASDLFQEFALSFLSGDFRKADPGRGRFRDYVKVVLGNMIARHYKQRQRGPRPLPEGHPEPAVDPAPVAERDPVLLESWRDELLARSWAALAQEEERGGPPYHAVLRLRADQPELRSPQLAEQLAARLGRPVTATAVRQLLHRARERFADLLVEDVAHSLGEPTQEQIGQELGELGLLEHCRPALDRLKMTR